MMQKKDLIEKAKSIINKLPYSELNNYSKHKRFKENGIDCILVIEQPIFIFFGSKLIIRDKQSLINVAECSLTHTEYDEIDKLISKNINEFKEEKMEQVFPGITRDKKLTEILNNETD